MARVLLAVVLCCMAIGAAYAGNQTTCPGLLYLGNGYPNGLFVDVATSQAVYSRHAGGGASLLEAMRGSKQQTNVRSCGERCVRLSLEEGAIVLAFRQGREGFEYQAGGVSFRIRDIIRESEFGFSRGDLYWIEYRGGDRHNPSGTFVYSSLNGVISISMANDPNVTNAAVGATLTLLQPVGLLSLLCAVR